MATTLTIMGESRWSLVLVYGTGQDAIKWEWRKGGDGRINDQKKRIKKRGIKPRKG